jgi:hypothetical protein
VITIYLLRLDKDQITRVQEATNTTKEWGVEPTHGLFGSPEWWNHIREGTLPVHHVKGIITRVYSAIGWPEFAMRAEDGKEYTWSRHANDPDFDNLYTVGRAVEIDYVIQRLRAYTAGLEPQSEVVIAVRVGEQPKAGESEGGLANGVESKH